MLFSKSEKTYPLTYEGIDAISEQLDEWLVELRVERRNHVLLRLTIEEALLRICHHFGQKADQSIHVEMGTNLVDSYVRITHRGRAFNPLGEVDAVANQWSSSLVTSIGLRPHYSYMSNTNVLRVSFMRKKMNPALALIIGLSLGTLVGVVGNLLMPQSVQDVVIHAVVGSTFEIALRTGSLEESYGEAEHSCVKLLGIDSTFTSVTLPQGLVIYMPASVIGTLVFTVFDAEGFNVAITLQRCAAAVVLDVLLFVATSPVPGANLLAFITLFNYLGIPSEALLDAMIFDILFGLFANAANQALLQIELVQQSDGMGLLDRETLRS